MDSPVEENRDRLSMPATGPIRSRFGVWRVIVLTTVAGTFAVFLLTPSIHTHSEGRITDCKNNLRNLALALLDYGSKNGSLPPVYTTDGNGMPLCSWRTQILPEMDWESFYTAYRMDEPWDSPSNSKVSDIKFAVYNCPSDGEITNNTSYVAVIGPDTVWRPNHGTKLSEIKDPAHTILLIEMKNSGIKWAEPRDLDLDHLPPGMTKQNLPANLSNHAGFFNAVFADGHAQSIRSDITWEQFESLLSIKAG